MTGTLGVSTTKTNVIRFDHVSKWFGDFQALKNISLSVSEGEKVVICGPSGSGKSTLIRCINALENHDQGSVEVLGEKVLGEKASANFHCNCRARNGRVRNGRVGMVFQHFNLFPHMTVLENLMIAPIHRLKLTKNDAQQRAFHFLERVKIAKQAHKYPNQLSGGQQQRVAIARSLCMKPEILLFDEPTSALDPEMINEVLDVMVTLAKEGMTMVCVTHEMGFARKVADRIVFMDEGEIVEIASPEILFNRPQYARTRQFLDQILSHQCD